LLRRKKERRGELTERPGEVRAVNPANRDVDLPFREDRHPSWERREDGQSPYEGSFEVETCRKGEGEREKVRFAARTRRKRRGDATNHARTSSSRRSWGRRDERAEFSGVGSRSSPKP